MCSRLCKLLRLLGYSKKKKKVACDGDNSKSRRTWLSQTKRKSVIFTAFNRTASVFDETLLSSTIVIIIFRPDDDLVINFQCMIMFLLWQVWIFLSCIG